MLMRIKKQSTQKNIWRVIQITLAVFTVLGIVKSLFVSLDIDESYAIAQAYRLVTGDKLIFDLWEPHQFSAFLPAAFLFPFYKLFQTTDRAVLFLRICGTLLHLWAGIFLYRTAEGETGKKTAFLLLILHLNFLPKWIVMPEFELMHYWCMLVIFLMMHRYEHAKGELHVILAALFYVLSGLCYPTMVLLFPVYLAGILLLKRKKGAVHFAMFSLIPTAVFMTVLISGMGMDTFMDHLGFIFSDPSHASLTAAEKIAALGSECLEIAFGMAVPVLAAALFTFVLFLTGLKKKDRKPVFYVTVFLSAASLALSVRSILGYLILDENQFTMQVRYLPAVILFLILAILHKKETKVELWFGILPALLSLPAVVAVTNMGVQIALSKLFPGIIAGIFMLGRLWKKSDPEEEKQLNNIRWEHGTFFASALFLLLCLFFCKIPLIRVTGCLPVTVKAPLTLIKEGPAKGIFVPEKPGIYWNESYDVLKQLLPEDKNILYVGREQLFYVAFCERVCTPSVQGTTVFNEIYETYFEKFPGKMPQIMVFDQSFNEEPYYANPVNGVDLRDEWIREWMENKFAIRQTVEVGNYTIYYLEDGEGPGWEEAANLVSP